jgi:hypothetical protein
MGTASAGIDNNSTGIVDTQEQNKNQVRRSIGAPDLFLQSPLSMPPRAPLIWIGRGSWIRTSDLQYPKLIEPVSHRVRDFPT